MPDLRAPLRDHTKTLILEAGASDPQTDRIINDLADETTDIEQVITFLSDSPSRHFRRLSEQLQGAFEQVLRDRLDQVARDLGPDHSRLYGVLIDMHHVPELPEDLTGFLTLNYDRFLEHAIEYHLDNRVDYGIASDSTGNRPSIRVIKLHGSFDWKAEWPMTSGNISQPGHWIPPGVRKTKERWPFNALWGLARELLDCHILRIVGCNLGPNDWDLVSMLFTTQHTHQSSGPYQVEVIASPQTAKRIQRDFPYLQAKSLLELDDLGPAMISESIGGAPRKFSDLDEDSQNLAVQNTSAKYRNSIEYWLRHRAERINEDYSSIETPSGLFRSFLERIGA